MPTISLTLGAGATQIIAGVPDVHASPTRNYCTVQNNAAHPCAVGGSSGVTLNTGILLPGGTVGVTPGGSYTMPGKVDLTKKWIIGTAADVITVDYD